jgi:hypothetical protein
MVYENRKALRQRCLLMTLDRFSITTVFKSPRGSLMPRRSILSTAERDGLLALPGGRDDLIRHYTFSETDLSLIRQRRGPANR